MTTTPDQPLGDVLRDGDRRGLRYERRLAHPPETVWRALTESEHLRHWMPTDIVGERRAGASIDLPFWAAQVERYEIEEPVLHGEIRVWDPPSVFEWTWDTDLLRWELAPHGDGGTVLTFTTWLGDPGDETTTGTAAGYHVCLDQLVELLDEGSVAPLEDADVAALEAIYASVVAG